MARDTWLTPYFDIWKKWYGGDLPAGKAAKALKPVVDELGAAEAERRFYEYCRTIAGRYADVVRFAQTHGSYAKTAPLGGQPVPRRPATAKRVI